MVRRFGFPALALAAAALVFAPSTASAQLSASLTGGVATPVGDIADVTEAGFTIQGRSELSLLFAGLHTNVGFTRLSGTDVTAVGETVSTDDFDLWNVGIGARIGLGMLLWGGANVNYYAASDTSNEFGVVPEVGASIGPFEAIADFKVTGDVKWWSLRGGIRF